MHASLTNPQGPVVQVLNELGTRQNSVYISCNLKGASAMLPITQVFPENFSSWFASCLFSVPAEKTPSL